MKRDVLDRSLNWMVALVFLVAFAILSISFFSERTRVVIFGNPSKMTQDAERTISPVDIQQFTDR